MKCPCPGNREFETLDQPIDENGQSLYVCSCCGTLKLLPELVAPEIPAEDSPIDPPPEDPAIEPENNLDADPS